MKDKTEGAARLYNHSRRRERNTKPHSHENRFIETMENYIYATMIINSPAEVLPWGWKRLRLAKYAIEINLGDQVKVNDKSRPW